MAADPLDFTNRYNTTLSPQREQAFQAWSQALGPRGSSYDYDMRGAFAAGAGQAANGHFPDTFKKPNHPTFSDQSKYSGVDGFQGGAWAKQQDGSWSFTPSTSSLKMHDAGDLQAYFQRVEAGNKLNLPAQPAAGMPDFTAAYTALQKADAAGDSAGARQLADYIRSQQAPSVRMFDSTPAGLVPTGSPEAKAAQSPIAQTDPNSTSPTLDSIGTFLENARAAYGKAAVDLGRGAGQWLGLVSRQDVADSRQRDAPLMGTVAGKVGGITGSIVNTLPALAIPGANTVVGAGLIGAATGALQPSTSTGETARNIGVGGLLGSAGQVAANAVAKGAANIIASRTAKATADESQNAVRDATLKASQDAGYVVPPSATNPSMLNTALESASGRYATKQAAQVKNQVVTNKLAAADLGLPANQPITQQALQNVRSQAGQVYKQVKGTGTIQTDAPYLNDLASITNASEEVAKGFPGATTPAADKIDALVSSLSQDNFTAAQAVEYTKRLRQQAAANFKLAGRSANPEDLALAQAQSKGAAALEDMIGRHLDSTGKPQLLQQFQDARKSIAKTYTIDAALNDATGNVDARILAKQLERNPGIDGGLKTAGEFGQAFHEVAAEPTKGPGVSKLAFASAAGGALTGHPELLALPVASTLARKTVLASPVNRYLAAPNYAPSTLGTLALKAGQQAPNAVLPATSALLPLIQSGQ